MNCICPILERPTEVEVVDSSRRPWILVRCKETGFVFLANPPDYSQLIDEFAWGKTWQEERIRRKQQEPFTTTLSLLARQSRALLFPKRNKFFSVMRSVAPCRHSLAVLDIGCGSGRLMEDICHRFAKTNTKIVPFGIEISRQLASTSEDRFSKLGGRVLFSSAIEGISHFASSEFDVIIMSSFLEHEARPLSLLRGLRAVLKPDGVVVIKLPNFASWNRLIRGKRWCGFRFPDHVNYFTPKTLRILANEASLTVSRQNILDRFPLNDNMYAVFENVPE